jgi:hypothetical protein
MTFSREFFASTFCFFASSSALNFSASLTILSISSVLKRPFSCSIFIDFFVDALFLSSAVTLRIEFASRSNATSICGTPRGAGGIP